MSLSPVYILGGQQTDFAQKWGAEGLFPLLQTSVRGALEATQIEAQEKGGRPFGVDSLRAIQLSKREVLDVLSKGRASFTTAEWRDVLLRSVGFEPADLGERAKDALLLRMVPFVERNYNMVELGPRGTGKSHLFQQVPSPARCSSTSSMSPVSWPSGIACAFGRPTLTRCTSSLARPFSSWWGSPTLPGWGECAGAALSNRVDSKRAGTATFFHHNCASFG